MSETEDKIVKVRISKEKTDVLQPIEIPVPQQEYEQLVAKALEYDNIFKSARQKLAQKYNDSDFLKCVNDDELKQLTDFHEGEEAEPKKLPSGKATIKPQKQENMEDIEEEDVRKFVKRVYREKPEATKELFLKTLKSGDRVLRAEFDTPSVKSESERYVTFLGAMIPEEIIKAYSKRQDGLVELKKLVDRGEFD